MENEKAIMTFDEFERDWKRRHKASLPRKTHVSSWGLIFGIVLWALIATGAALVSGAHSIPAILQTLPPVVVSPLREYLSLFGFTILELLIFAGAVYRRESRYALWALIISMIGALAANIGSSIYAVAVNGGDTLNLIVAFILAVIAPLAAFLAGEMVHLLRKRHDEAIAEANATYDKRLKELDTKLNKEYDKYCETSRSFMKSGEAETLHETSRNPVKPRVKLHEVARQIHENGDAELSANEMMAKYGISLGSTSKVREILKNGHSNGKVQ